MLRSYFTKTCMHQTAWLNKSALIADFSTSPASAWPDTSTVPLRLSMVLGHRTSSGLLVR